MATMSLDKWVPFRNASAAVRCRVFAFPHAGGNAALYQPLRRLMPPEIDFCPVELPGHAARLNEPPLTSISAVIEQLLYILQPLMDVPFAFFGHSVGAWIAYEAARQLRAVDGRSAVHLFVSGRDSPDRGCAGPPQHPRSDEELISILHRFGGTPPEVMQCPELLTALLPALRADLEMADRYVAHPTHRIDSQITAFAGLDDVTQSGRLDSWSGLTRKKFRICTLPGGHFYFLSAPAALAKEIVEDLRDSLEMYAVSVG
jgi:medium-chain acyl-[acyl-carrier-protein] hydrolase